MPSHAASTRVTGETVTGRPVAEQFDDADQQTLAATFGMWCFLATEVLFFGGMFVTYISCRTRFPEDFAAGSGHMDFWLGTVNTGVLLTSSLLVALAHHAAETGRRKPLVGYLAATILLGLVFLGIKFYEYYDHISNGLLPGPSFDMAEAARHGGDPRHIEIFFCLYFAMTGFHALHMLIGCGLIVTLAVLAWRRVIDADYPTPVAIGGLYWHFVDIVWVFLYPLLYLAK
jgi:cytochrome c oxidase subunit 3